MVVYSREWLARGDVDWHILAAQELRGKKGKNLSDRLFRSLFGVPAIVVHYIHFVYLLPSHLFHPCYILWTLSFCKNYESCLQNHMKFRRSNSRTFQDKVWETLAFLYSNMEEVIF
jgi:hypothetical protein